MCGYLIGLGAVQLKADHTLKMLALEELQIRKENTLNFRAC